MGGFSPPFFLVERGIILKIILKIEEYFISILFSLITLAVLLEVVFRYLLYFSLAWVEDIAMFLFIWFIGIGASVTAAKKADIRITVLFDRLPPKLKLITEVVTFVLWGILLIAVTLNAWKMASLMFRMGSSTMILEIPLGAFYLAIVVGFILALIKILFNIYKTIFQIKAP